MTQINVCKSPFPSAGTAVSLFHAKKAVETTVAEIARLWGHILGES